MTHSIDLGARENETSGTQVVLPDRQVDQNCHIWSSRFVFVLSLQISVKVCPPTLIFITVSVNDPLRYKPNPSNLVSKLADENSEPNDSDGGDDSETSAGDESSKLYVPPRVMAMPYQEDTKRDRQHIRNKAVRSSLIQELRDEFTDAPAEVKVCLSHTQK